ncbi:MAG: hypothetical protein MPJ50_05050 [Pirellulales bacterium]|nr:hypothetical protein [Pirellulales bacterium]
MSRDFPVPSYEDINVFDSLDERAAAKNFLGKDLKQAEEMFQEGLEFFTEDLMFMGPQAFCYYVQAAIAYLTSPASKGDETGVFSFCSTLEFWLSEDWEKISPVHNLIQNGVATITELFRQRHFDPNEYEDVPDRYKAMLDRMRSIRHE